MALDSTGLLCEGRHKMEAYKNDSVQTAELAQSFAPDVGVPDLLPTIKGSKAGTVTMAGVNAACKKTNQKLSDQMLRRWCGWCRCCLGAP